MKRLTVLYDADCALCRRARDWLGRQTQLAQLRFVAAGSEAARRLYPTLDHERTLAEITVIGDGGEVFRGAKAWVVCLWALADYRSVAFTLRSPTAWWAAKQFVDSVAKNRHKLALPGDGR